MFAYRLSAPLRFGKEGVQVGFASLCVGVECHDKGVEGAYGHAFGIEPRLGLA